MEAELLIEKENYLKTEKAKQELNTKKLRFSRGIHRCVKISKENNMFKNEIIQFGMIRSRISLQSTN